MQRQRRNRRRTGAQGRDQKKETGKKAKNTGGYSVPNSDLRDGDGRRNKKWGVAGRERGFRRNL